MGIRERVLTSRLIESIDANKTYADQIGLSYTLSAAGEKRENDFKSSTDSMRIAIES